MMQTEPDWDLWRAFIAVMAAGTLSGAARALALTQPTIGRQIEALEAALGAPLFVRSPQGLTPTDAAHAIAPLARNMAAAAGAIARAAYGAAQAQAGIVRVTASEVMSVEVLPEMLASFRADNPDIEIELSVSNRVEDLLTREADLAVRMTSPIQQALVGKKIGAVGVGLYGHRDYLERAGAPRNLDELAGHTLIGYDANVAAIEAIKPLHPLVSRRFFAIRTDSEITQLALVRAGVGIGGMQDPLARRDRNMIAILPGALAMPLDVWLVVHEDLRRARAVQLLFAHLERKLKAYVGAPSRRKT